MKAALVFAILAVGIVTINAALTCWGDEERCAEDECCIQLGTTFAGMCKKKHTIGERCEMKQLKNLMKPHVYRVMPPCADGLKCVEKDGLIGKVFGKCGPESSENTDDE